MESSVPTHHSKEQGAAENQRYTGHAIQPFQVILSHLLYFYLFMLMFIYIPLLHRTAIDLRKSIFMCKSCVCVFSSFYILFFRLFMLFKRILSLFTFVLLISHTTHNLLDIYLYIYLYYSKNILWRKTSLIDFLPLVSRYMSSTPSNVILNIILKSQPVFEAIRPRPKLSSYLFAFFICVPIVRINN